MKALEKGDATQVHAEYTKSMNNSPTNLTNREYIC